MNAKQIRDYWVYKYESTFGEKYANKDIVLEMTLLKKLVTKYNEYVVLEAIDSFFMFIDKKKAAIQYFSSPKIFESKFQDLIKNSKIMKFKRFIQFYPDNLKEKIKDLIEEYEGYSNAEILSDEEKNRRNEIVESLEGIKIDFNSTKASRR